MPLALGASYTHTKRLGSCASCRSRMSEWGGTQQVDACYPHLLRMRGDAGTGNIQVAAGRESKSDCLSSGERKQRGKTISLLLGAVGLRCGLKDYEEDLGKAAESKSLYFK